MSASEKSLRVSIVATPDAQVSPTSGLFETLNAFEMLAGFDDAIPRQPFKVEIVAPSNAPGLGASGLPLGVQRHIDDVDSTDIVVVPLMMVAGSDWVCGRYPETVDWLRAMHREGAMLCSACTGVLLLAETGLLAGHDATIHWAFAPTFRRNFPKVRLRTEEVLVAAGDRNEFVMTGGVMSWHDLALHLITRHVGEAAAQAMARMLLLQWHAEGQAPYMGFSPRTGHGDATVRAAQEWLQTHYMVENPVDEMQRRAQLAPRSFERRFLRATGHTPIAYVQNLRVEEAKRRLERTDVAVDQIASEVGYENPAFFRRVFKRCTRLTPGSYRRRFRTPDFAAPARRRRALPVPESSFRGRV